MEIHHSIIQKTLSLLVDKIFKFKADRCPENKSCCLSIVSDSASLVAWLDNNLRAEMSLAKMN